MKEKKDLTVSYYGASDIGLVRTENQDCFGKFPKDNVNLYQQKGVLFIVADGMGGHSGGKEASQLAVKIVSREYDSFTSDVITSALLYAFKTANRNIYQSSKDSLQFHKKGTTCSALVLENDQAHIAHVGDSRIYKIANGMISQITTDHTEVSEMLKKGILTEEEAKNHPSKSVLVRAMGIEADIEVDLIDNLQINPGDNFILCSDGLGKVDIEEIKEVVLNNSTEEACKKLISMANDKGGKDNVTVQVIKIIGDDAEKVPQNKSISQINKTKWFLISILILIIVLLGLAGIFYQHEIINLFSNKSNINIDSTKVSNDYNHPDATENILNEANKYLSSGNLDSAMVLYNFILNENPLHVSALNGKEQVSLKYIQKGDKSISDNKTDEALLYYKKAFALNPDDKELGNKIILLQKNIQNSSVDVKKQAETKNNENVQNKNQQLKDSKNDPGSTSQAFISPTEVSEWDTYGLTEKDFKPNNDGFTFFNNDKSKKIIYKQEMKDIDIEVDLQFDEHSFSKAGIIVGYTKSENDGNQNYYLFTVDNSGSYSLIKFQNGKEDLLLSGKRSLDINKKIFRLKIKCLGPWIMLYNDNKLLESYLSKDFIKGRLGLYSEKNTQANFTDLKISSAFEKNN